jgi:hypothetical protein
VNRRVVVVLLAMLLLIVFMGATAFAQGLGPPEQGCYAIKTHATVATYPAGALCKNPPPEVWPPK